MVVGDGYIATGGFTWDAMAHLVSNVVTEIYYSLIFYSAVSRTTQDTQDTSFSQQGELVLSTVVVIVTAVSNNRLR